jgi:tetratricopeptide (TPR) repeat protein
MLLVLPIENFAQDVNVMLTEARQQESAFRETEAFLKYAGILKVQPSNLTALCKCSELCSRIGNRQKEKSQKTNYFKAAKNYAQGALRVNPNNADANFVMALALGRLSLISSGKEKIIVVNEIKQYAEKAISLDPYHFKAYHLLGKWNYEVSNLNAFERALAKLLYGGLPEASLEKSIVYYEKSRSLNPDFVLNYLELARAYHRQGERKKAIEMLTRMMPLPNNMLDDTRVKEEGKHLLQEWQ